MAKDAPPTEPTAKLPSETTVGDIPAGTSSSYDRIKASLENWKRKLLDLSKRNRALNFKVNKVSTITIVDEQPAEVFRQLYLKEQSMRFRAVPEDKQVKRRWDPIKLHIIETPGKP